MIITISGNPGSGKSTVAKILVERLGLKRVYVGEMLRRLAREKGMTINTLMEYAKTHPEVDQEADQAAASQARKIEEGGGSCIVEGRVQFHFLPESIKIFVHVDSQEGARRIWKDLQQKDLAHARNEDTVETFEEMKFKVEQRDNGDTERYKKLYGVDTRNLENYDLVVDSTSIPAIEVAEKVCTFLESKGAVSS